MTDELGDMLNEWARQKAPPDEHLNSLAQKITTEAARQQYVTRPTPHACLRVRLAYSGIGAAVMLVVCLAYLHFSRPGTTPSGNDFGASFAAVTAGDLEKVQRLYKETQLLFEDRLRWVAESNGDIGMGVEAIADGSVASSPMFVRLTVVARQADGEQWEPLWNTDVLVHGQEMVEMVPNPKKKNKLALWVYELEDGKLATDTKLSLHVPVQLASTVTAVVSPGEPTQITSVRTADSEYRVFQTVVPLGV